MIYFISDTHFNHKLMADKMNLSVINYNDYLIEEWNKRVSQNDTIYHLGDFAVGQKPYSIKYLSKILNGSICLIKGNHDKYSYPFNFCKDYYELNIEEKHIILFHYPIESWNRKHYGSLHFHGHTHIFENKIKNRYSIRNIPKKIEEIII